MDAIREQMKKPLVVGVAGLVLGILLGIFYGWVVDPVEWVDGAIVDLRDDLQEEYLRMAIDSYTINPEPSLAITRFDNLGENGAELLTRVLGNPGRQNVETIRAFASTVQAQLPAEAGELPPVSDVEPTEEPAGRSIMSWLLPIMCVVTLVIAGGVFYIFYGKEFLARRGIGGGQAQEVEKTEQTEWTDYESMGEEPPIVQFMTTYEIGDDLFNPSFNIDSPSGKYLGECGVGIAETLGPGEPNKVTAFDVWLFDNTSERRETVTVVLMSAHAYLNEALRQKLEPKGELVLAEPGKQITLDSETLRLVTRVVDMAYAPNALASDGVFRHMILEYSVWERAQS